MNHKRRAGIRRRLDTPLWWSVLGIVVALGTLPGAAFGQIEVRPGAEGQAVGAVHGFVYDSVAGAPMAGVDVVIWNTTLRTRTNGDGWFSFDAVPVGSQELVVVSDALLSLGVSAGSRTVRVTEGQRVETELASPSPFTILRNLCLLDGGDPESALVVGRVDFRDLGSGVGGITVGLGWVDDNGTTRRIESVSDDMGWYRFCSVPRGISAGVIASYGDHRSERQAVDTNASPAAWLPLTLAPRASGSVSGSVQDHDRGWPIEDAEVSLLGSAFETQTNSQGDFRLTNVPVGEYMISIRHIAYGERRTPVSVTVDHTATMEVPMSLEAIELDPIVVEAESIADLDGVIAGGRMIDAEAVEAVRHRATDVADLLRMQRLRDIIVRRDANGEVCVGVTTGQVRMMYKQECTPMVVYVDNARVAVPSAVLSMHPDGIDRMVVYRPLEAGSLFGLGAGNGVLMIYTKSGRRPSGS